MLNTLTKGHSHRCTVRCHTLYFPHTNSSHDMNFWMLYLIKCPFILGWKSQKEKKKTRKIQNSPRCTQQNVQKYNIKKSKEKQTDKAIVQEKCRKDYKRRKGVFLITKWPKTPSKQTTLCSQNRTCQSSNSRSRQKWKIKRKKQKQPKKRDAWGGTCHKTANKSWLSQRLPKDQDKIIQCTQIIRKWHAPKLGWWGIERPRAIFCAKNHQRSGNSKIKKKNKG